MNSASLTPLLSAASQLRVETVPETLRQPLQVSVTAAAQMIISLSSYGPEYVWKLDSQAPLTFPDGPFHADPEAIGRLYYAVDSTWISYTFAVTFLVICYMRGAIDGRFQVFTMIIICLFSDQTTIQKISKLVATHLVCIQVQQESNRLPGRS